MNKYTALFATLMTIVFMAIIFVNWRYFLFSVFGLAAGAMLWLVNELEPKR